jgi:hypothetical protein
VQAAVALLQALDQGCRASQQLLATVVPLQALH